MLINNSPYGNRKVLVANIVFAPATPSTLADDGIHAIFSSLFGRRSFRGSIPVKYLIAKKNRILQTSILLLYLNSPYGNRKAPVENVLFSPSASPAFAAGDILVAFSLARAHFGARFQ